MNHRDAKSTARQSRNRTKEGDRKIEDRKMEWGFIFLSSIFLSSCLSAAPLRQLSRSLRTIATVAAQREEQRRGSLNHSYLQRRIRVTDLGLPRRPSQCKHSESPILSKILLVRRVWFFSALFASRRLNWPSEAGCGSAAPSLCGLAGCSARRTQHRACGEAMLNARRTRSDGWRATR
jgi:hypothetical protein